MNEEALNTSVRKFLKKLGVTAQREIEKTVREAVATGRLKDGAPLPAKAVVSERDKPSVRGRRRHVGRNNPLDAEGTGRVERGQGGCAVESRGLSN